MANALITPTMIAKEAAFQLEEAACLSTLVHRELKKEFHKVGATIQVRKPVKFTSTASATLDLQDVEEAYTTVTVPDQVHVAWPFSARDLTLTIEEYSERYIKPAVIELNTARELKIAARYVDIPNMIGFGTVDASHPSGTPGTVPSTFADFGRIGLRADQLSIPQGLKSRNMVWNPEAMWKMADGLSGKNSEKIVNDAIERISLSSAGSMRHFSTPVLPVHTMGTAVGTAMVRGATQNVAYADHKNTWTQNLVTDAWTGNTTHTAGTVISIVGVNEINPVTRQSNGVLKQFVIKTAVTSNATSTNATTLVISPPMITSGPYQNCTAAPADDALIYVVGTASTAYPQSLLLHKNAIALVDIPLEIPDGVAFSARQQGASGSSIRVIKDYDIVNDRQIIRLDTLCVAATLYPDLAIRASN